MLVLQLLFSFVDARAVVASATFKKFSCCCCCCCCCVLLFFLPAKRIFIICYRFDLPRNGVLDCTVLFKTLISSC